MRALVFALLAGLASPAFADASEDIARGRSAFLDHCATCHGRGAAGDGPMAEVLSVPPADLTRLGRAGDFPAARIVRRVDGRAEVLAHGGPMPLFGLILDGPSAVVVAPDGAEIATSETVAQIVAWLGTVQR